LQVQGYFIGPFTLDSLKILVELLQALEKYDLAVIAKPTENFTDENRF
jgi:hypothetical protein